jgi:hypothetical protein
LSVNIWQVDMFTTYQAMWTKRRAVCKFACRRAGELCPLRVAGSRSDFRAHEVKQSINPYTSLDRR